MRQGVIQRDGAAHIGQVWMADTMWLRARGLLARAPLSLEQPQGLWIAPCASVHTFGMRYALDLAFVDRAGVVVGLRENLRPWRMAGCRRAMATVEFAAGAFQSIRPRLGECWTWQMSSAWPAGKEERCS